MKLTLVGAVKDLGEEYRTLGVSTDDDSDSLQAMLETFEGKRVRVTVETL